MYYFLGIEILQTATGLFFSSQIVQKNLYSFKGLLQEILNAFQTKYNPMHTRTESGLELNQDREGKKKEGERHTL